MTVRELVLKNRSYRRFDESKRITREELLNLVDLARLTPCAANKQGIKYYLSTEPVLNEKIYSTLGWAGYLTDWPGPVEGERPAAYIVILRDKSIGTTPTDEGIVMQTILLGATEMGYGGCMLGNIKRADLSLILNLGDDYEIGGVVALGVPVEKVELVVLEGNDSVKYFRDEEGTHYVPKRKLEDLII